MREMARIQTFPDDVVIQGGISNIQKQLGNAVPSGLAEVIGREMKKQFFEQDDKNGPILIPTKKHRNKNIDYTKKVPEEYLLEKV